MKHQNLKNNKYIQKMTQELELKNFEVKDLKLNLKLKEQEKEQIKSNYEK